jgi:hypothetical protein
MATKKNNKKNSGKKPAKKSKKNNKKNLETNVYQLNDVITEPSCSLNTEQPEPAKVEETPAAIEQVYAIEQTPATTPDIYEKTPEPAPAYTINDDKPAKDNDTLIIVIGLVFVLGLLVFFAL